MAITALQIYTLAALYAKDEGFNANTAADYLSAAEEAQKRLAELLKNAVKTDTTLDTVDGTQYYSLPADYMAMYDKNSAYGPVRIYQSSTGKYYYPDFYTLQDILNMGLTDLYTLEGEPKYCWTDVQNRLWIYPIPNFSGTNNIQIEYYNYPTTFLEASTICDYPNKFLHSLALLTAEIIAEWNEVMNDAVRFHNMALIRLNSVVTAGDNINTNKNKQGLGYIG